MNKFTKSLLVGLIEQENNIKAFFGGGFKPPTKGHFEVAKQALERHPYLDELIISVGTGIRNGVINGYNIDCSVLCQNGNILAYTIQKGINQDSLDFKYSAHIDFVHHEPTFALVKDIIHKLNWSGVAHLDLRYDEENNQIKIIEINPRYWGTVMGSLYAGVNFPYLHCLAGLNISVAKETFQPIRFMMVTHETIIRVLRLGIRQINRKSKFYDYSNLKEIIKDPLTFIFIVSTTTFSKIKSFFTILKKKLHISR